MGDTLYDEDFVIWTQREAEALRQAGRESSNLPLDFEHLAEEIGDLGSEIRHKVESLVLQITVHLLKLSCSTALDPRAGWMGEIDTFRVQLRRRLARSPSIRAQLDAIVSDEFSTACGLVERDLRHHGERDALEVLAFWKGRGVRPEDILADGRYPVPGSTELSSD